MRPYCCSRKHLSVGATLLTAFAGLLPTVASAQQVASHGHIELLTGGFGPSTTLSVDLATGLVVDATQEFAPIPAKQNQYVATPSELAGLRASIEQLGPDELNVDACSKPDASRPANQDSNSLIKLTGTGRDMQALVPGCQTPAAQSFFRQLLALRAAAAVNPKRNP